MMAIVVEGAHAVRLIEGDLACAHAVEQCAICAPDPLLPGEESKLEEGDTPQDRGRASIPTRLNNQRGEALPKKEN